VLSVIDFGEVVTSPLILVAIKALVGGTVVVAFAAIGEFLRPRGLAGILAAAPSVAVGSLAITVVASGPSSATNQLTGMVAGPVAGGLFLAFPAILPATLTLLEKKEGLAQAVSDMRGAAVGSLGMVAFAVTGLLLMTSQPALALIAALIAWILAALASYLLLRLLARVLGEKQYLPEIATQEAASVIEALSGRGFTLGLAESCTGGTIAALLTDVPGAGKVIRGSI